VVVDGGQTLGMVPLVAVVVAETFCVVVVMVMVIGMIIRILTILDPG